MCRISLITDTTTPRRNRAMLMHDMMLRSNAEAQFDGWGVYFPRTDALGYYKGAGSYLRAQSHWLDHFVNDTADGMLLGHVRSASPNTARSQHESHPFVFVNEDKSVRLVGAHNGMFNGSYEGYVYLHGDPSVDSFRVFSSLSDMLDGREITAELIDTWISQYEEDSAFAITILQNDRAYIFRNTKRELHIAQLGSGFIMNTSPDVLEGTRAYARVMFDIEIGEPQLIDPSTLFVLTCNDSVPESVDRLRLELRPPRWKSTFTRPAAAAATTTAIVPITPATTTNTTEDDELEDSWWRGPLANGRSRYQPKQQIWDQIRATLNPCRQGMASLYASMYTYAEKIGEDLFDDAGRPLIDPNWQTLSEDQLQAFLDHIKENPLSSDQRHIINQWNRKIDAAIEIDEQVYAFGSTLFWHLPTTIATAFITELSERAA